MYCLFLNYLFCVQERLVYLFCGEIIVFLKSALTTRKTITSGRDQLSLYVLNNVTRKF